ncbi:MAG: hypothetical protein M1822_009583 [Bathelium mastoideum]|nr:MAG: hypothetical protein M1822_009583 [Bathelium mastoideum]
MGNANAFAVGAHSPVRDRFFSRLYKTFMLNLDGEKAWRELVNTMAPEKRARYHRLNLSLKGPEPAIDDVAAMRMLKTAAEECMSSKSQLSSLLDSIHASIFYLELDDMPYFTGEAFHCSGHIFCRLELPRDGKDALMTQLLATSAYFLINGAPVVAVGPETKKCPLFRRRVRFEVTSLEDSLGISIRGLTSRPRSISGMPKTLNQLIHLQQLQAPFGHATHRAVQKHLPQMPLKRKATWSNWQTRKQAKV